MSIKKVALTLVVDSSSIHFCLFSIYYILERVYR